MNQLHPFLTHLEVRLNELKEEAIQDKREFGGYSQETINPFSPITDNSVVEEFETSAKLDYVLMYFLESSEKLLERLPWKVAMEARLCNHYSKIPDKIETALIWLIEAHKDLAIIDHIRNRKRDESIDKEPQQKAISISLEKAKGLLLEILKQHQPMSSKCSITRIVDEIADIFIKKLIPIDPESNLTEASLYYAIISWRGRDSDFKKEMDQVMKRIKADAKSKNAKK